MAFTRLVRFIGEDGQEHLGEAGPWYENESLLGKEVVILEGDVFSQLTASNKMAKIKKLLCPIEQTPVIVCIGINYQKHADECQIKVPPHPVVFMKPADALAGPGEKIPIPVHARSRLDYEGELCVVIRGDCKDVSEADALSHVLGFAVGNDVSAREWQTPEKSGGQFTYAKSFDKFAPIGPCIASTNAVQDPRKLRLQTLVNGEKRQSSGTDDLIWSIQKIIAHASAGTTLRKGTVIMTGTPSGVAAFMQSEDAFLKNGDVVDIQISGIGTLSNTMEWM